MVGAPCDERTGLENQSIGRASPTNSAMARNGISPFAVQTQRVGASSPFKKRSIRVTSPICGSLLSASRQLTVRIAE